LADIRIQKYANVLVEHSARVKPGDRILLEGTTAAEPILRELYIQILEKGGHPHLMMTLPGTMPMMRNLTLCLVFINWLMTSLKGAFGCILQQIQKAQPILTR
jgi:hypothetical protein